MAEMSGLVVVVVNAALYLCTHKARERGNIKNWYVPGTAVVVVKAHYAQHNKKTGSVWKTYG